MKNSVIWVTGASKGIGYAVAEKFALERACVVLSSRSKTALDVALKKIVSLGGTGTSFVCDVRNAQSIARTARQIEKRFGQIDVLINNAGIAPVKTFADTPLKLFDETIGVNLRGMFACTQAVVSGMMGRKSGTIVNVLSTAALRAFSGNAAYCASKFGALGLTRVLRTELKKYNIRVIAIFPGAVETEMWDTNERKKYHDRMLQPEDVGEAIFNAVALNSRAVAEEIILRPMGGDL